MYRKRSRGGILRRLLLSLIPLFIGLTCLLWGIPQADAYWKSDGAHLADAAEATLDVFLTPEFGPDHVHLSLLLQNTLQTEGISEFDLKAIIAAAATETYRPGRLYEEWVEESYEFAALLLGLAKIESNYCKNIGQGSALEELEKRQAAEPNDPFWTANLQALEEIADGLRVDVEEIPGSIGAGAISCFQLMPSSWLSYGDGDYRRSYQAALNAARFLKAHGYPDDPWEAIRSYNYNAGESYAEDVFAAATVWEFPIQTAKITEPLPLNWKTLPLVYLEFLAWYVGDYKVAAFGEFGPAGEFVHPYLGSIPTSYFWLQPVYTDSGNFLINHPAQDYGGIPGGPVVAAHNGIVTYAQFLSRHTALAIKWWISGNVIVIRGDFEDGTPVCTFYGHGASNSIGVSMGQRVSAGEFLMMAGTTGVSSGVHLHFAVKVGGSGNFCDGGTWVDPNQYVN